MTIARNEYKYVAEVETDFDELPQVTCHGSEVNQVMLNIIVNAAHAIGGIVKGTGGKGLITVQTRREADRVAIRISDTGGGIPEHVQERMCDPFFTTKGVGKGTGQGLAIARSVIVDKHQGSHPPAARRRGRTPGGTHRVSSEEPVVIGCRSQSCRARPRSRS